MVRQATRRQVRVRVPATTANLGCGFDVLGLALQMYNTFTLTLTPEPGWRAVLPDGVDLPSGDDNLVFKAARAVFARVGSEPAGLQLCLDMDIPLARGLGSSSAAIVG
ncbi:MAG: homoserine kinase, partial [Candidatus Tectomicrobia bacterium]|nr:homoserine kinase [Candidatus Tectomicrobia bacterium]